MCVCGAGGVGIEGVGVGCGKYILFNGWHQAAYILSYYCMREVSRV